jgi:hypothetical protein
VLLLAGVAGVVLFVPGMGIGDPFCAGSLRFRQDAVFEMAVSADWSWSSA